MHSVGRKARGLVDKARRQVAARVGALPTEVIFTSGGTEANNMALAGAGRRRVLISSIEHESVQRAVPEADIVPVDGEGVLDLAALERKLAASDEPALVSVMFANNETGVLQPMADVVRIARKAGRAGALRRGAGRRQGAGRPARHRHRLSQPRRPQARRADRRRRADRARRCAVRAEPLRRRAGNQSPRRHGEPVAASWASAPRPKRHAVASTPTLRDRGEAALLAIAPDARVFGAGAKRLPNTTYISMPGVPAETQVMALDLAGVCVSAGSACSSGKVHRSAVLAAMGIEDAEAGSAIRISFGWNSQSGDIDRLIAAWRDLYIRVGKSDIANARAA